MTLRLVPPDPDPVAFPFVEVACLDKPARCPNCAWADKPRECAAYERSVTANRRKGEPCR